jgi:hypothetical protein
MILITDGLGANIADKLREAKRRLEASRFTEAIIAHGELRILVKRADLQSEDITNLQWTDVILPEETAAEIESISYRPDPNGDIEFVGNGANVVITETVDEFIVTYTSVSDTLCVEYIAVGLVQYVKRRYRLVGFKFKDATTPHTT